MDINNINSVPLTAPPTYQNHAQYPLHNNALPPTYNEAVVSPGAYDNISYQPPEPEGAIYNSQPVTIPTDWLQTPAVTTGVVQGQAADSKCKTCMKDNRGGLCFLTICFAGAITILVIILTAGND